MTNSGKLRGLLAIFFLVSVCFVAVGPPTALAQDVVVSAAVPDNAAQGTVNLDVQVKGNGFKKGAIAKWLVTGSDTDTGGVTVNSTTYVSSTELRANITVSQNAQTEKKFDIKVTLNNGRTGKGTGLFCVTSAAATCNMPFEPTIAFWRSRPVNNSANQYDLVVMNADGSCPKAVHTSDIYPGPASWSPDGRFLTFSASTADPDDADEMDLFVVAVPAKFEDPSATPCVVPTPELGLNGRDWPDSPAWSPVPLGNGAYKLAYRTNVPTEIRNPDGSTSTYNGFALFAVDIAAEAGAGGETLCTSSPPIPGFSLQSTSFDIYGLRWSPDGKYLALIVYNRPGFSTPEGWDLAVYPVVEADGSISLGQGVNLTPPAGSRTTTGELAVFTADWGKQSNQIVFQARTWDARSQSNVGGGFYVIDLGTNVADSLACFTTPGCQPPSPVNLALLSNWDEYNPNWSADDSKIVCDARTLISKRTWSNSSLYWLGYGVDSTGPHVSEFNALATPTKTENGYYQPVWKRCCPTCATVCGP